MNSRVLFLIACTLGLAPAMRLEENFAQNEELFISFNRSVAESQQESGAVVSATWAAFNLAYDLYEAYETTKHAYEAYKARKKAVDDIVGGHTKGVGLAVQAAHTELADFQGGSEELQGIIDGDTFNHFKDLLGTFEKAQEMCVDESEFFKDPVGWFVRFVGGPRPDTEELEHLDRAKFVIDEVVKSLQGVIDDGVCPHLKRVVMEDLLKAQEQVEDWEDAVMSATGGMPTSYYELMYEKYASSEGRTADSISHMFMNIGTKVMDEAAKITKGKKVRPDRKTCYVTAAGQGGNQLWEAEIDKFEIVFDKKMPDSERLSLGLRLRNTSTEINMALDRASMNMEMYHRECKRKAPAGRDHIIQELSEMADQGDRRAVKMHRAVSCDFCMRYGCRELGVLSVLHQVYRVARYGVDKVILAAAKVLLPKWVNKILKTIAAVEDVLHPAGDHAVEFYCSVIFLLSKGSDEFKAGETCIEMGLMLEEDRSVRETLGELAKGISPISRPQLSGKLQPKGR